MSIHSRERRIAVLLEHDRANEHINAFKLRIRAYVRILKAEAYKQLFGVGAVTVAFTTSKGENHVEKLRQWTRQELTVSRDLQTVGLAFYFTNLAQPLEPQGLWLEPGWKTAVTNEPLSLLAD